MGKAGEPQTTTDAHRWTRIWEKGETRISRICSNSAGEHPCCSCNSSLVLYVFICVYPWFMQMNCPNFLQKATKETKRRQNHGETQSWEKQRSRKRKN